MFGVCKKLIVGSFLVGAVPALAQPAVSTAVQFGPYINCVVANNSGYSIAIQSIIYNVQGNFGPAQSVVACKVNCMLLPGHTNKFTGPANNPNISTASCFVYYTNI